jgi:excisionase family DNA binding protein
MPITLPEKDLFRVDEVATYFSITTRTVRSWILSGKLPAEKIVGTIRISRDSVLNLKKSLLKKQENGNN